MMTNRMHTFKPYIKLWLQQLLLPRQLCQSHRVHNEAMSEELFEIHVTCHFLRRPKHSSRKLIDTQPVDMNIFTR